MSEWARQNQISTRASRRCPAPRRSSALIAREIEAVNDTLARVEQVKKFRILPKELDPEEGDTTPTRKIKRKHLCTLFEGLIEDMYVDGGPLAPADEANRNHRPLNEKLHA